MSQKKENTGVTLSDSLSKKIISKLVIIVAVLFFLIVTTSAFLSMRSLEEITDGKLISVAYENAFLIENSIEGAYGKTVGFANSLKIFPRCRQRSSVTLLTTRWPECCLEMRILLRFLHISNRMPLQMPTERLTASITERSLMKQLPIWMKTARM